MKGIAGFLLQRVTCLALLWAVALPGQSSSFAVITPAKATLLIGDSRSFRLVDQNGHMQRDVSWSISDPGSFQVDQGDELSITAKQAGDFRISARSGDLSAEAAVTVMEGDKLPVGTKIWSSGTAPGCKSTKLTQAMPSAGGPDMYEQSQCADGDYITALTADGIQLWRRRIGAPSAPPAAAADSKNAVAAARLNLRSTSICDSVVAGTDQQKIRELLHERNLSFSEGAPGERAWVVEEPNTQCKLWFDDRSVLTRKRKVFVAE
jgi:hypothetical protein